MPGVCPRKLPQTNRGTKDYVSLRILHPGSKAPCMRDSWFVVSSCLCGLLGPQDFYPSAETGPKLVILMESMPEVGIIKLRYLEPGKKAQTRVGWAVTRKKVVSEAGAETPAETLADKVAQDWGPEALALTRLWEMHLRLVAVVVFFVHFLSLSLSLALSLSLSLSLSLFVCVVCLERLCAVSIVICVY